MDFPRRADPPQASRAFDTSTPLLELPAQHVAVLHGRARTGRVAVATRSPGWRERSVPVEDLSRYLELLPVGQDIYLSQARFHGPRRIVNLAHLNACWLDVDYYRPRPRWSSGEALYALLGACEGREVYGPSYVLASGRGLAAVWLLDTVLPTRARSRWQAAQDALVRLFADLDRACERNGVLS